MTAIDHTRAHARSVAWFDAHPERHRSGRSHRPELYELRLALEMQAEAMLLTLGAAARDDTGLVPWERWLLEDVETARGLVLGLVAEDVEPSLTAGGGALAAVGTVELLDLVVARYAAMDERLSEALRHAGEGGGWRAAALEARARCRTRIEELHAHRSAAMQRAALAEDLRRDLFAAEAHTASATRAGVPGEMLG